MYIIVPVLLEKEYFFAVKSIIYGMDVMYIMKRVYFLLFLIIFTGLAFAEAESKFTQFVVPDNYFELPVPDGWEFVSVEWLGERTYLFSPSKVTREELERGVDLEASFKVKISRMPEEMLSLTSKELMELNIEHLENGYRQGGYDIQCELGEEKTLMGIDGYTASLTIDNGNPDFLFIGLQGKLAYEVQYSCDADKVAKYDPLLFKMLEGMRLLDYTKKEEVVRFKDDNNQFSLLLPRSWSMKQVDDGKVAQLFISREAIKKDDDLFKVGVTITKIRQASNNFKNVRSDSDLVKLWGSLVLYPTEDMDMNLFEFKEAEIDGKFGFVAERSIHIKGFDFYEQEIHIILAKDDNLYNVVLEAPVMEFEAYRNIFNQAIDSLILN